MIQKLLSEINEADLLALISGSVSEGRSLEFKRDLAVGNDLEKREFLADASSFANTAGGDLIYGLDEVKGVPTQLVGIQCADVDLEIQRLENILASGLDPRIRCAQRSVACSNSRTALVIRIERSWIGPHRVVFKGHDKFYGRNSSGKYPLDVNELRAAFVVPSVASERIRAFRTDRIIAISNDQTPLPLPKRPRLVLHCIPIEAFAGRVQYDLMPFYLDPLKFKPIGGASWDRRLNLDGVVTYSGTNPTYLYTQLYRNGVIEAVDSYSLSHEFQGRTVIPSIAYEQRIFEYLPSCFRLLIEMGVAPPVLVAMTLTGVRGLTMGVDEFGFSQSYPIESDTVILPETLVPELTAPPGRILKPMFDLIWNACGYPASRNFDSDGNWVTRR